MDKKEILLMCLTLFLTIAIVGAVFFIIADKLSNEDLSAIDEITGLELEHFRPVFPAMFVIILFPVALVVMLFGLCIFFIFKMVETWRELKNERRKD
jgi:phosphatidylglycerophosphatase A